MTVMTVCVLVYNQARCLALGRPRKHALTVPLARML